MTFPFLNKRNETANLLCSNFLPWRLKASLSKYFLIDIVQTFYGLRILWKCILCVDEFCRNQLMWLILTIFFFIYWALQTPSFCSELMLNRVANCIYVLMIKWIQLLYFYNLIVFLFKSILDPECSNPE